MAATTKTYTDIRFFLKNPETTRAFEEIEFTGTNVPVGSPIYPNADFNNQHDNEEPYVNLVTLSNLYELKSPTSLGVAEVDGTTIREYTPTNQDIFENLQPGNYILYRIDDQGDGPSDLLRVLGYVSSVVDSTEIILRELPPAETNGQLLQVFSWEGNVDSTTLKTLNFNFQDNFYMVVKNTDYTSTNHDGVLYIDTARTAINYNNPPAAFAYSISKIINPNYFTLQRISKSRDPETSEVDVTNIQCSIKGVSKWSEKEKFEGLTSVPLNQIPYWSVYEINPFHTSNTHLDKRTFYRLTIPDWLPSSRVYVESVPTP